MARKSFTRRLHDYFLPHKGNQYKPRIFSASSVIAIMLLLFVLEAGALGATHIARSAHPHPGLEAGAPQVLGAETNPILNPTFEHYVSVALASPTHLVKYLVIGLLILIVFLLLITLLVQGRVPHPSVIVGSVVLLLAVGIVMYANVKLDTSGSVTDTQSALDAAGP